MAIHRITQHPILEIPSRKEITFTWNRKKLTGYKGETIASALYANGIHVFGYHPKDKSPQGIFCANGQCSQCLVLADGLPVKSCMTPIRNGMDIKRVHGIPKLPFDDIVPDLRRVTEKRIEVLIIGGGPAGLSAAVELGKLGVKTLVIDDKDRLGGKLVLQTHKFFGSIEDSYAGTRGSDIAKIIETELKSLKSVEIWRKSAAVGIFSDKIVGVIKGKRYIEVKPKKLLIATGAREKMLSFPGNTLPGVYGAGAFQTLVNRDLVKPAEKIIIVGGGNVGLITGYHALQAGMTVVALIEAMPRVSGYKVHADKLKRLGVPIHARHTIVCANGTKQVESVTIAGLNKNYDIITGTYKTIEVDTVLIAVGLAEVNEFYLKAMQWGMDVYSAGDAQEISEASAAMFTGKIEAFKIAKSLGLKKLRTPKDWETKVNVLKSKPGTVVKRKRNARQKDLFPVLHCYQHVPCDPCTSVCPAGIIKTENNEITGLPYLEKNGTCTGCANCVAICPGLCISLVDYRKDPEYPLVTLPYEIQNARLTPGDMIYITDVNGNILGRYPVKKAISKKKYPGTFLAQVQVDKQVAKEAVGILIKLETIDPITIYEKAPPPDEAIVCRCERVTAGDIRSVIRSGIRDMNQIKALTRAGMGACGSKTCRPLIWRIFEKEGIDLDTVTDRVDRPLFVEVPAGVLAGEQ